MGNRSKLGTSVDLKPIQEEEVVASKSLDKIGPNLSTVKEQQREKINDESKNPNNPSNWRT